MVIILGAFHINIWVAFIGFFLPLVMAFTSRNAACLAFLETQDCIRHSQSSFLRRVSVLWVTAVTVMTVILGYPHGSRRLSPHILPSEAARRRMGRA